jgi:metal-responsive CopG/Arc/MetJ family transcriptional regulator
MEVTTEDELMATVSALDKESALALLAVAQVAPDSSTVADVWAVYDIFKSLVGDNANWAHFLYLLRKLERLGLIKTVKLYKGGRYRNYSKNVMLTFRPSYDIIRELALATDAQVPVQRKKYTASDLTLVSFKMPVSLNATLSKAARSLGVSKSELIRRALEAGLEYVENTGRLPPCVCSPYERMVVCSAKVPRLLLQEVDSALMGLNSSRSEFIRDSAFYYYVTSVGRPAGGGQA